MTSETAADVLAASLKDLRVTAALTQEQLGAAMGWPQPEIARAESGRYPTRTGMLSPAALRQWAEACGEPEAADDLLALRADATAARDRQASFRRKDPDKCPTHNCDPAECAGRTHTTSVRAKGDLMAEVYRAAGGKGKVNAWIVAAMQEKLGQPVTAKPPARRGVLSPAFMAPPEAGS